MNIEIKRIEKYSYYEIPRHVAELFSLKQSRTPIRYPIKRVTPFK